MAVTTVDQAITAITTLKSYPGGNKWNEEVAKLLRLAYLNEIHKLDPAKNAANYATMRKKFTDVGAKL